MLLALFAFEAWVSKYLQWEHKQALNPKPQTRPPPPPQKEKTKKGLCLSLSAADLAAESLKL